MIHEQQIRRIVPPSYLLLTSMCFYRTRLKTSKEEGKGKSKQTNGQTREGVGKFTNNKTEQIKGKIEQVEEKVQEEIGKVKIKAKEQVDVRAHMRALIFSPVLRFQSFLRALSPCSSDFR